VPQSIGVPPQADQPCRRPKKTAGLIENETQKSEYRIMNVEYRGKAFYRIFY